MDEYNEYYKAWEDGFKAGVEAARKETFKDHYEALCAEIRADERKKIFDLIKSHYQEKGVEQ